jgi:hypothetical protein
MARGGSKPGERRGGRQKGTPNTNTRAFKEAVEAAFQELDGVNGLVRWAKSNPDQFYGVVFPKLAPLQVNHAGRDNGPIEVRWQTESEGREGVE